MGLALLATAARATACAHQRGGGLVQNKHARCHQQCPRNGQPLALAAAELRAALAAPQLGGIPLWQRADEAVGLRCGCRRHDLLPGRPWAAVADDVVDPAFQQPRVLGHQAQLAAPPAQVQRGQRHAIHGDGP